MLFSLKYFNYSYIGKTASICRRILQHNSGVGSTSTEPTNLKPFYLLAYICDFNYNNNLLFYTERVPKKRGID